MLLLCRRTLLKPLFDDSFKAAPGKSTKALTAEARTFFKDMVAKHGRRGAISGELPELSNLRQLEMENFASDAHRESLAELASTHVADMGRV